MEEYSFFMVYSPQGQPAKHRHGTYEAAFEEAKRLANLNQDKQFYVLQAIQKVEKVSVTVTALVADPIPF